MHKLMRELLALVPPDGSPWPHAARQRWIAAMGAVLDVLYEDGLSGQSSTPIETAVGAVSSPFVDGPPFLPVQDEPVSPQPSATDRSSSVLDLRSSEARPGRHARPGSSDG